MLLGRGVRLSVGLMIIIGCEDAADIGDAIPTYVLFSFFFYSPPRTPLMTD